MITNVVLENVTLSAPEGLTIRNARGVQLRDVKVTTQTGEKIIAQNAEIQGEAK
jgi:hypothetical protein